MGVRAAANGAEPGAPVPSATSVGASPEYFADVVGDPLDYANFEDQLLIPAATGNMLRRWRRTRAHGCASHSSSTSWGSE